ncbi:MAG: DUF1641 domain-containing protein, partial [Lewinella sp.]|nr:DUF1641 domain-containing protein [Lewinella sp.]
MSNTNGKNVAWYETEAGREVNAHLSEERALKALDHLISRIETLEQAVDRLAGLMEQGPGLVAMTADMADEIYRRNQEKGVVLEERLANALYLAERLTSQPVVDKLENLLAFAEQAPGLIAMAMDMGDEVYRQRDAEGIYLEQRLSAGLALLQRLTNPHTIDQLNKTLDIADHLPGLTAMAVDVMDETYQEMLAADMDLGTLSTQGIEAMRQVLRLVSSEEFKSLMESGILSPATLSVVASAGHALVESKEDAVKPIGAFGALRALGDKDRQKALGFLMN